MSQHVGRDSAEPPVVTVRLAPLGRQGDYALGSRDLDVSPGSVVVVEGLKGVALGTVVSPPRAPVKLSGGVRRVVRLASTEDLEAQRKAEALEPEQARLVLRWLRDNEPTWKLLRIAPDGVARKVTICFGAAERAEARGPAGDQVP